MRRLRRVEHAGRGRHIRRHRRRAAGPALLTQGPRCCAHHLVGRDRGCAAYRIGHCRARPRDRWRLRAWIGYPGRWRSGDRQVDASDAGCRGTGQQGASRHLCVGRGSRGTGQAASAAAGCRLRTGGTRRRNQCRGYSGYRFRKAAGRTSSSSIRSRHCGPTLPIRRREPSPRSARRRRPSSVMPNPQAQPSCWSVT